MRKKIAVFSPFDPVNPICVAFSNAVLIEYRDPVLVNIPNPSKYITDPSCHDGKMGV